MMHGCHDRCRTILRERFTRHPCPPTWNSLTAAEQAEFEAQSHAWALTLEQPKRWSRRALDFFGGFLTRRQRAQAEARLPRPHCATCSCPEEGL